MAMQTIVDDILREAGGGGGDNNSRLRVVRNFSKR